jgi:hypothetical protein
MSAFGICTDNTYREIIPHVGGETLSLCNTCYES